MLHASPLELSGAMVGHRFHVHSAVLHVITPTIVTCRSRSNQDPNIIFDGEPFIGFQAWVLGPCSEIANFWPTLQAELFLKVPARDRESGKFRCAGLPG